jgi:glycosyltransferase involved in cell wall biosynthesis
VIVGDGPARAALQAALPQAIFTGAQQGDELSASYASADLFLFPSQTETWGNVTTEAMASGLAVLAFDAAAAAELITSGEDGVLAPVGHSEGFLHLARLMASDPQAVRTMGRRASHRVRAMGWDAVVEQLESHLMAAVTRRSSGGASIAACPSSTSSTSTPAAATVRLPWLSKRP